LTLHCFAPGLQATQAPLRQAGVPAEQAVPGIQAPALHVCGTIPMHSVWPGAQTPPHAPLAQVMFTHATGEPHCPLPLQVWTPFPEHWVLVGEHATHVLLRQTGVPPEHEVCVCQVPVLSQVWMALPRQRDWPATQVPAQAFM
jgi:hypothetical protein